VGQEREEGLLEPILERKRLRKRLTVDKGTNDDNSVVGRHGATPAPY
jgi:hypothetical protein